MALNSARQVLTTGHPSWAELHNPDFITESDTICKTAMSLEIDHRHH